MSKPLIRVLHVDDDEDSFVLVRGLLPKNHGLIEFEVDWARTYGEGLAAIGKQAHDAYLLGYRLDVETGLDLLRQAMADGHRGPFIILSGLDAVETDLSGDSLRAGAVDFLSKSEITSGNLARSILFAVEHSRHRATQEYLRLARDELELARTIQQQMQKTTCPVTPGLDIAYACQPAAETGGDFYDVFSMPEGRLGLVVADVSSHGFGPALVMAETRRLVRTLARTCTDPTEALTIVNQALVEDTPDNLFVTLFLATLDIETRTLMYGGAGHEAYLLSPTGDVCTLPSTGLPLGIIEDADYRLMRRTGLIPGEVLVLLTDGFQEAHSQCKDLYGLQRTLAVLHAQREQSAQRMLEALFEDVFAYCRPGIPQDDLTAVIVKVGEVETPGGD